MVGLLVYIIDWHVFQRLLADVRWPVLALVLAVQAVARLVEAFQLKVVISVLKRQVTLVRVFLANSLAAFYSFVLPGDLLATIPKWLVLSRDVGSRADILNAIAYNRLALLVPPVVIGSIALANLEPFPRNWQNQSLYGIAFVVLAVVLLIYSRHTGPGFLNRVKRISSRLPKKVNRPITTVLDSFGGFHRSPPHVHLAIYSVSVCVTLTRILAFVIGAHAVGIDVPTTSVALAYSIFVFLAFFPITIGNLGIREGVLIFVFSVYGIPAEQSILLGVILYLDNIIFAIVGAMFQWSLASREKLTSTSQMQE